MKKKKVFVGLSLTGELERKGRLILPYAGQIMHELFVWYLSQLRVEEVESLFWQLHGKTYTERQKIVEKVLKDKLRSLTLRGKTSDAKGKVDLERFSDLL